VVLQEGRLGKCGGVRRMHACQETGKAGWQLDRMCGKLTLLEGAAAVIAGVAKHVLVDTVLRNAIV
jgi:hypothetical protein